MPRSSHYARRAVPVLFLLTALLVGFLYVLPNPAGAGLAVDTTPPTPGTVNDGVAADIDTQTSTTALEGNWFGFSDNVGITNYWYGISTNPSCATRDWVTEVDVGTATNANSGTILTEGDTYYVCINAYDAAGNPSGWVASDGVTVTGGVDVTPPTPGTVNDGVAADIDTQTSTTGIDGNWFGFSDNVGITNYWFGVSTGSSCATRDVVSEVDLGMASAASWSVSLTAGDTYYVCINAYDAAGNPSGWVASDGVTVDTTDPTGGTVNDGPGADIDTQTSTTILHTNWTGFTDNVGVDQYQYGVSSASDCATRDVIDDTGTNQATSAISQGPPGYFAVGTTYYGCARAMDAAGNFSPWVASDGITIVAPSSGADLEAGVDDSADPVVAGTTVTYTARVRNLGSDTATNVTGTIELPAYGVFVSATPGQGTCGAPVNKLISCNFGTIASGATVDTTVVVRMTHAGSHKLRLLGLDSAENDPVSNNNSSSETTTVNVNTSVVPGVSCTVVGTSASETLDGTPGNDTICLLGGNDVSNGKAGNDRIIGGTGVDNLQGGGMGTDTLEGNGGGDTLNVKDGSGGDAVHGGDGSDTCKKDAGDTATGCP